MIFLKKPSEAYFIDSTKHLKVVVIPCLKDNYTYLVLSANEDEALLFDCADYKKTLNTLKVLNLKLNSIFITHHHYDHVDGIDELIKQHPKAKIYCSQVDIDRKLFKAKAQSVKNGQTIDVFDEKIKVFFSPGHTKSLMNYFLEKSEVLFCGDHIFSLGCGRVFEAYEHVYQDFYKSLQKLKDLPPEALIYCAHEYTLKNLDFHQKQGLLKENTITQLKIRTNKLKNTRTIPSTIAFELEHNFFLKAKTALEFEKLRCLKDSF